MTVKKLVIFFVPISIFVLLRVPSVIESYWYGDESIYAAVAQEMLQGKKLYSEVWDHKPPLIFLIYYLGALLRWDVGFPVLKILNTALGILTIVFVNLSLAKMKVSALARVILLTLFAVLLGSTYLEGNALNAEVVFIVFNTLVFYLLLSSQHFGLVGFLMFLSLMTKVPGFVEVALITIAFIVVSYKENGIVFVRRFIGKVLLGFSIPAVLTVTYFSVRGSFADFIDANFVFNTIYSLHGDNYIFLLGYELPKTFVKLLSVFGIFILSYYWYWKSRITRLSFFVVNLLAFQIFASLLSGRNYGHYFIQVAPGIILILALLFQSANKKIRLSQMKIPAMLFILLLPSIFVFQSVGAIPVYAPPIHLTSTGNKF